MAEQTKIEWADATQNWWTGCTKISDGCQFCYASALAARYPHFGSWAPGAERKRTSAGNWRKPLAWDRKAKTEGRRLRVFSSSLSDFFDNRAPAEWRTDAWEVIRATRNLDWLMLTKRPENIRKMLPPDWGAGWPHVWLGTTVEDARVQHRIATLRAIPAAVRFLSIEPLIGPLDAPDLSGIAWVITGGESGAGARFSDPTWTRAVRDACEAQGVAFFMKQWGTYRSNPLVVEWGVTPAEAAADDPPSNGKGGALLDGKLHRAFPASPAAQAAPGAPQAGPAQGAGLAPRHHASQA
jgi:protein gp37